jgi:Protein of unknown function (DUF1592)/Protein of unknown function (DUF1588)/Protein of unknown function (DUF1585)/Protein of unknown function (DUF1587)/Protein of unknown function (DUF1595)/Planctomycete cytochrome C
MPTIRGCATSLSGALAAAALVLAGCSGKPDPATLRALGDGQWRFLDGYCLECHNDIDLSANLAFDTLRRDDIAEHADVWERVVRKLRGHMMPPPGGQRPSTDDADRFVTWLEASLDQAAPTPRPGYIYPHRLNRTEYAHAIRDLLALDVDPTALLPVDGAEAGFDNIANALHVSPTFIDQFLSAARTLSAQAVGTTSARAVGTPYTIGDARGQQFRVPGLPLGTRGGALIEHYFPSDGEYRLNIGDLVTGLWELNQEHVNTLIALYDGKKFFELDIGGGEDLKELDQIGAPAVDAINARLKNIPFTATAGMHKVGVTFLHRSFAESDRELFPQVPGTGQDSVLTLGSVEIFGPVRATGLSDTPSRKQIFVCYPSSAAEEQPCAREIVAAVARRAFRGAFVAADLTRLMPLYDQGAASGGFENGIKYALSGVLAHPKFLYRFEPKPDDLAPGKAYALSSVELASRLSFFLWSTIPDDELLALAEAGRLSDPGVLEQQVARMLADSRAETLASNFAFQWLGLGELEGLAPDPAIFADVDRRIREHFVTEAEMFVDSIFRSERSIVDLLTAKHTFLNEALARHYGINDVRGDRFRRVELTDENRFGLLGKGGVLLVSSYPDRTSPVLRGAWLLKNVFGSPPPTPPPNVEALVANVPGKAASTVRERLEAHRTNPSCKSCHHVIDPLGFALENFDAVGRWRDRDLAAGVRIDASGVLADGTPVEGSVALREAILRRPEQFVQTLTEKLMTYGLGRSLDYTDMPTVRAIVRAAAGQDYRFSALVWGIVNSPQFRQKGQLRGDDETLAAATGD